MARYSSDSDSDRSSRHRRKHYGRSTRSSSCDSSDSCSYKKRSSNKYSRSRRRRGSKSGDREATSSRSYKSSGTKDPEKVRRRRGKKSQSRSPERNGARRKPGSPSAARSADDKTTGVFPRDEFCIEPRFKEGVLEEIDSEGFAPKSFSSSAAVAASAAAPDADADAVAAAAAAATATAAASTGEDNKFRNVVIDVSSDTIKAPAVKNPGDAPESIFHSSITRDREARLDKWVKKLYTLRQKAITEATHANLT